MQEIRRFKPSTVSWRFSVAAGFHRTCVLDGTLEHSPAEHVRRPTVPAESPTLGLTHLQFEALLTAARESPNRYDFALVAMLSLRTAGPRSDPAQHPQRPDGPPRGHPPPVPPRRWRRPADENAPHMLRHTFVTFRRRRRPPGRPDRRPSRRPADHDALRTGPATTWTGTQLHPGRLHGLGNLTSRRRPGRKPRETPGRMADIADPAAWSGCQGLGNRAQDLLLIGA
jgi:hypothetical protein